MLIVMMRAEIAQEVVNAQDYLLQQGILGVVVLVLGTFAWQTIKRLRQDLDDALTRERDQQKTVYEKILPVVERMTALADARATLDAATMEIMKDVRRLLERGADES